MKQLGLFDWKERYTRIDKNGDPLVELNKVIPWEDFRSVLSHIFMKARKSNAGAKPYDVVLMFKILILQSLYNLSDDGIEYQILDRLSFMRFLSVDAGDKVPDSKTIWLFREKLKDAGIIEELFSKFDNYLNEKGFSARKGQIIDASIVPVPKQRNSREENKKIKNDEKPENWSKAKARQKDTDARWTKKNGVNYFGYKNHISVDDKHKLIRAWYVTAANVHDSQVFEELIDEDNSRRDVYADSAYRSVKSLEILDQKRMRAQIQRKGCRNKKLSEWEKQGNKTRSKIRSRIEHVFGIQVMIAGTKLLRGIGSARALFKIGLRNLAYNMFRYKTLTASA